MDKSFEQMLDAYASRLTVRLTPGENVLNRMFSDPEFTPQDVDDLFTAWLRSFPLHLMSDPDEARAQLFTAQVMEDTWGIMVEQAIAGRCSSSVLGTLVRLIELDEPFLVRHARLVESPQFPLALVHEFTDTGLAELNEWMKDLVLTRAHQEVPEFVGLPKDLMFDLAGALGVPLSWYQNVAPVPRRQVEDVEE